jgi:hypothetical protein
MIILGGWDDLDLFNTGGIYDPGTDSWKATSMTNVPGARFAHTAVWTGSEMIVWGGWNLNISIPAANSIQVRTVGHPPARQTRPRADGFTRQSGPAVKWSSGVEQTSPAA